MTLRVVGPSLPPPMDHRSRLDEDVGRLFDYLVEHKTITYEEAGFEFDWTRRRFLKVGRQFRLIFANDDVTLVCAPDPEDLRGPWVYEISPNTRVWHTSRVVSIEAQLVTMEAVARSALHALDGRSTLGRWERLTHRYFSRLLEDIAELREQQAM